MADSKVETTVSTTDEKLVVQMEVSAVLMKVAAMAGPLAGQSDYDEVALLVEQLGDEKDSHSVVWRGGEMAGMMAAWLVEHWAWYSAAGMVDR